jgi:hypothetical protein
MFERRRRVLLNRNCGGLCGKRIGSKTFDSPWVFLRHVVLVPYNRPSRLKRSAARFLLSSSDTAPAACSVDTRRAAATARRRSWLVRHSSTGWDRVAIHGPARWPEEHSGSACADAPGDAGAVTRRAGRAVPGWVSKSPESSASFVPSAVRVNIETVYSARREADLLMTSTGP